MGKRIIRIGLLPVIVVIALVTNMSSGIAHAASYQDFARAAGSGQRRRKPGRGHDRPPMA